MSTIHFKETTTATPEPFIAGLTDFGPGRSKLFGNSADEHLKVHSKGAHEADVTEGSNNIWERLRYDWSNPDRVVLKTTDSNLWGGASGHTYTFTRQPNGTTDIDVIIVREGKNLKENTNEGISNLCISSALNQNETTHFHLPPHLFRVIDSVKTSGALT
jgi:hypothetical protein